MPDVSKLVGLKQIAEYLQFSKEKVRKWAEGDFDFPARRLDGTWISEKGLVDRWWTAYVEGKVGPQTMSSTKKTIFSGNSTK